MYVCTSCGKMLDIEDYNESQILAKSKIGCFFWLVIIIFGATLVLIPVLILLYYIWKRQQPESVCPYCLSKNSIIPADTPIGKKILKENYSEEEILKMDVESSKQKYTAEKWNNFAKYVLIFWLVIIVLAIIITSH